MTNTVLRIDASARHDGSESRALTQRILDRLAPQSVIQRDLATAIPSLDADWLAASWTPEDQRSDAQREKLALSDSLIAELKAADTLVIGTPIYNFGIPAPLKAWIDQIARAGVTFRYTEAGPEGFMTGKRASSPSPRAERRSGPISTLRAAICPPHPGLHRHHRCPDCCGRPADDRRRGLSRKGKRGLETLAA